MSEEKRVKKLAKKIEGGTVFITEGITDTRMSFNVAELPEAIQKNLAPYGLSQKLGDAAAGKEGQDAVDSIRKIWEGLLKGDWTVRVPAAEKVTKAGILEKFNALAPKEQAVARGLLEKLGLLAPAQ